MGKIVGVLGIVLVAGTLLFWKFTGSSEDDEKTVSPTAKNKELMGTSTTLPNGEKQVSIKKFYSNPSGSDEVGFTVTVDGSGVITGAMVEVLATNGISQNRQKAFAEGLPEAVKGKKLAELTAIDRVGGSSLTTGAFNAALPELKAQL